MSDNIQSIDFEVDLQKAMIWQYDASPILRSLVEQKDAWYQANHVQFWQDWIINVFDIRTCNQFGLIVWGIILNIPIYMAEVSNRTEGFGFGEYNQNFFNSNFLPIANSNIKLSIDAQRILLRLRYYQLTGRCSVSFINKILHDILGDYGVVYALDPLDMSTINYVVTFQPSDEIWFILHDCNVLPRPAGLGITVTLSV